MRSCTHCGEALPFLSRADARYCAARCRVAAMRVRRKLPTFPTDLTDRPRWVRRDAAKVPLQTNGRNASSTNPRTWSSFDEAVASPAGVGLGFVLNGDGVVCVDLDHVFVDGVLAGWAAELLAGLPPTFVERSPSGDGLHVWGWCDLPFTGQVVEVPGGSVEVYGDVRYLTMTGESLDGVRHLADLTEALYRYF